MRTTEIGQIDAALVFADKVVSASLHSPGSVQRLAVDSLLVARTPPSRDNQWCAGLVDQHAVGLVDNCEA